MKKNRFSRGVEIVGSAIIENSRGKILLTRSPKWHNKWTLPGGHIEPGERIGEALLREAKEETGLKLKFIKTIAFGELINSRDFHRPAHFIYFDIVCKVIGNKEVRLEKRELSEYMWVKPKEALKMNLAESYPETIREYIKFKRNK